MPSQVTPTTTHFPSGSEIREKSRQILHSNHNSRDTNNNSRGTPTPSARSSVSAGMDNPGLAIVEDHPDPDHAYPDPTLNPGLVNPVLVSPRTSRLYPASEGGKVPGPPPPPVMPTTAKVTFIEIGTLSLISWENESKLNFQPFS